MESHPLLSMPHSRKIASTEYQDYYSNLYESEIVQKSDEFNSFFQNYSKLKKDEKAFEELKVELKSAEEIINKGKVSYTKITNILSELDRDLNEIAFEKGRLTATNENLIVLYNYINKEISEIQNNLKFMNSVKTNLEEINESINSFNDNGQRLKQTQKSLDINSILKNYRDIALEQNRIYENERLNAEKRRKRQELNAFLIQNQQRV